MLACVLLLSSCNSSKGNEKKDKATEKSKTPDKIKFPEGLKAKTDNQMSEEEVSLPQNAPPSGVNAGTVAKEPGSETAAGKPEEALPSFYEKFIRKKKADANAKPVKAALNFDNVEVSDVISAFASSLKFSYLTDPEVKGAVTMYLDMPMTEMELWSLFEQCLRLCGSYCVMNNGVVNIVPFSKLPQQQRLTMGFTPPGNAEVLFYKLKTAPVADVAKELKPFMSNGATLVEVPRKNSLLIVDAMSNMPKLIEVLKFLDERPGAGMRRVVLHCRNIAASRLMNELSEVLPVLGFPVTAVQRTEGVGQGQKPEGQKSDFGTIALTCMDRLQLIVAAAATQDALDELKKWVEILDRTDTGEQERVYIYRVINSKAPELVQALSVVFKVDSTTLSAGSSGQKTGSKTGKSGGSDATSSSESSTSSSNSKNSSKKDIGPASVFEVPVSIFADAVNNRLVIKTTPRTYAMLQALLKRLDTVPDQVLLQVLVAEVTLSDAQSFGMTYSLNENNGSTINQIQTNYADVNGKDAPTDGLSYLIQSSNDKNKNAKLKALAGRSQVKVISSPQILVTSHSKAKISVGDKVPTITSEITDTQSTTPDNTSLRRSYQYQETGIILEITPHVTKGKLVEIELEQTVSEAVKTTVEANVDTPTIQERVLNTSMSLRSGKTVIIGGMIKEKYEDNLDSVPMLIDVPFISHLLGSSSRTKIRTEMLVFITANIIEEDTELEKLIGRFRESVDVLKKIQPELKERDESAEIGSWIW
jgi:general secretion pathway protein D